MSNRLVIAAAGSGKTTYLIKEALKIKDSRVLITTYTQANEQEIYRKFIKFNKCVPANVTIQTWFSFLLQHGVRPYQGHKFDPDIKGLVLMNGLSAKGVPESNTERHYFTKDRKIYSDKLSKFVIFCNQASDGAVIDRLSRVYNHIFVDEVQDLAGYDLEILKLLFDSEVNVLMVGDPRQGTYSTNNSQKNNRFKRSKILSFFEDDSINVDRDDTSLTTNYRSVKEICELANSLYPTFTKTSSGNSKKTGHDGVFFIKPGDITEYLKKYSPMQLYDSSRDKRVLREHPFATFGKSKGLEFDRVLIYPTNPFLEWLRDNSKELMPMSRSKFYVAMTRAFYSVGIVYDFAENESVAGIGKFNL